MYSVILKNTNYICFQLNPENIIIFVLCHYEKNSNYLCIGHYEKWIYLYSVEFSNPNDICIRSWKHLWCRYSYLITHHNTASQTLSCCLKTSWEAWKEAHDQQRWSSVWKKWESTISELSLITWTGLTPRGFDPRPPTLSQKIFRKTIRCS